MSTIIAEPKNATIRLTAEDIKAKLDSIAETINYLPIDNGAIQISNAQRFIDEMIGYVEALWVTGKKILAIRLLRKFLPLSLVEARVFCEETFPMS